MPQRSTYGPSRAAPLASVWLAARNGKHVRRRHDIRAIGPIDGPETPLEVEFVGLTEDEQRAALAAFPGGRRFILKAQH